MFGSLGVGELGVIAFPLGILAGIAWAVVVLMQDPAGPRGAWREPTPWQQRGQIGLLSGLIASVIQLFTQPAWFFRRVAAARETEIAFPFILLIPLVTGPIGVLQQVVGLMPSPLRGLTGDQIAFAMVLNTLLMPIFNLVMWFVSAGVDHLALLMVGRARNGFDATARVGAYAAATGVVALVPFFGIGFGLVMYPVLRVMGLSECHGTTRGEAAAAVIVPYLACGVGLTGLIVLLGVMSNGSALAPFLYTLF